MKIRPLQLFHRLSFTLALQVLFTYTLKRIAGIQDGRITYSQLGEDIMLHQLVEAKEVGFYVDIGCSHPIRYNNTFDFYLRGWKGINVDANPMNISLCEKHRKQDLNVFAAVSDRIEDITFYSSSASPEVSTLDPKTYSLWKNKWHFDSEKIVTTTTLNKILEKYLPAGQGIDFISIDVEGNDSRVIKALDFDRYKPAVIVIEVHDFDLENATDNDLFQFLKSKHYSLVSYSIVNAFFKRNSAIE